MFCEKSDLNIINYYGHVTLEHALRLFQYLKVFLFLHDLHALLESFFCQP